MEEEDEKQPKKKKKKKCAQWAISYAIHKPHRLALDKLFSLCVFFLVQSTHTPEKVKKAKREKKKKKKNQRFCAQTTTRCGH